MELEIRDIFAALRRGLWLIILIPLAFGVIAAVLSYMVIEPQYKSTTSIIIDKSNQIKDGEVQYNDVIMFEKLIKAYVEVAKSDSVAERAVSKLGLDIPAEALKKKITVAPNSTTWILYISAIDGNPEMSARIANGVSEVFMERAKELINSSSVLQVIDNAKVPKSYIKPTPARNIALGMFFGVMLVLGIILFHEYMDNTVKTAEQIEEVIELPVVGIIPRTEKKEE